MGDRKVLRYQGPRGDSSGEGRAAHLLSSKLLDLCYVSDVSEQVLLSVSCSGLCFGEICTLL